MVKNKKKHSHKSGFSLIESLISLSLFLFMLISSLEFFLSTRDHFLNLKEGQETDQAAYATLDKIRFDLCECGRGLADPQSKGLLDAIQVTDATLIIESKAMDILPEGDPVSGQTYMQVVSTTDIKKGQKICINDHEKGEVKTIISVNTQGFTLDSPLNSSYRIDETEFILIRTISIYFDPIRGILRRKVNASPGQPLLEDVAAFSVFYEAASNTVSLSLKLKNKEEKAYEIFIFPKNMALASST